MNAEDSQAAESSDSNLPASVVETYSSGIGPLIGLMGTTDSRLNTITLVGESRLIGVAESYLGKSIFASVKLPLKCKF